MQSRSSINSKVAPAQLYTFAFKHLQQRQSEVHYVQLDIVEERPVLMLLRTVENEK